MPSDCKNNICLSNFKQIHATSHSTRFFVDSFFIPCSWARQCTVHNCIFVKCVASLLARWDSPGGGGFRWMYYIYLYYEFARSWQLWQFDSYFLNILWSGFRKQSKVWTFHQTGFTRLSFCDTGGSCTSTSRVAWPRWMRRMWSHLRS